MLTELVNDVITKLSDKSLSEQDKFDFIKSIALEHVDIKALSLYTIGELRKSTDKESLTKYQEVLKCIF